MIFVHFSVIGGEGFKTLDEATRLSSNALSPDKGLKAVSVTKL